MKITLKYLKQSWQASGVGCVSNLKLISIFFIRNCIIDKPGRTYLSPNNTTPLLNTSVVFNCTSDALPVAKYRFYRVTGAGENEVSTSSSASTGVLVISSIIHPPGSYIVRYKCVPYNMLGDGPDKIVIVDVQGKLILLLYNRG